MAQCIIVKKTDNGIIRILPNLEKFGSEEGKLPFTELASLQQYQGQGMEWFVADIESLPPKNTLESRVQWYHDGTNQVLVDTNWEVRLMPEQCIKAREEKRLNQWLDEELEKEAPDPVKLVRYQRDKDKLQESFKKLRDPATHCIGCLYFYELAQRRLDERVAGGEPDKPTIRQKLANKIQELQVLVGNVS